MRIEKHKFDEVPEELLVFKVKDQDLYGHPHYEDGKIAGIQIGIGITGALCHSKEEWEKLFPSIINNPSAELVSVRTELLKLKKDDKS